MTGGRIVNGSSGAATMVIRGDGAYCVSKAALNHLTRVIATEEPGITCLAARPGVVDTNMQTFLRERGPGAMPAGEATYYRDIKDQCRLGAPCHAGLCHRVDPPPCPKGLERKIHGL